MQSAAPAAPPALHLLTSYFIDSILGRGPAAGRHGEGRRGGRPGERRPGEGQRGRPGNSAVVSRRRGTRADAAARPSAQPRGGAAGGGAWGAPGRLRGTGSGEEEAAAVPHHVQHVPAGGAGARLLQVPLPRRVHQVAAGGAGAAGPGRRASSGSNRVLFPQRGAGPAPGPDGSPGAGECEGTRGKRGLNTARSPPASAGRAPSARVVLKARGTGAPPPRRGSGGSGTFPRCASLPPVLPPPWVAKAGLKKDKFGCLQKMRGSVGHSKLFTDTAELTSFSWSA